MAKMAVKSNLAKMELKQIVHVLGGGAHPSLETVYMMLLCFITEQASWQSGDLNSVLQDPSLTP